MLEMKEFTQLFRRKKTDYQGDKVAILSTSLKLKIKTFKTPNDLLKYIVTEIGVTNIDILPNNDDQEEYFIVVYGDLDV